ncbi:caspase a-like [Brachyistius frenatus]|uniref:caspase a-like n=1 Tax=Brachyistius frenatus TaxID=100188 RepID=UPI0037E817D9
MAEELQRVRNKFVEKVSKEVICQLLDDLLNDRVVNDGESESILEENRTRVEKARSLIDTVKKKGDAASWKMIAHLQHRDNTLHSLLGLSCSQPAQPAAEPKTDQKWSTKLTPTTEAFWREKLNDKNVYPALKTSLVKRVALLITNIKFTYENNRNGAEKDQEKMEELLSDLGYEVVKHTNLTGKAIDDALIKFSKHQKIKETDSVVVVIMSHGKLGVVCGVDCKKDISGDEKPDEFPINNIFKHLNSKECPALLNKPKVIIIQACRGAEKGSELVSDNPNQDVPQPGPSSSAVEGNIEDDKMRYVHTEKDFTSLLSCTPDTVSYRHSDHGSFLIQYIVDVFNTCAHEDDIEELFTKVMRRFEGDVFSASKRQMPTKDRCTLTKRFYFFPGLSVV